MPTATNDPERRQSHDRRNGVHPPGFDSEQVQIAIKALKDYAEARGRGRVGWAWQHLRTAGDAISKARKAVAEEFREKGE